MYRGPVLSTKPYKGKKKVLASEEPDFSFGAEDKNGAKMTVNIGLTFMMSHKGMLMLLLVGWMD